MFELVKWDNDDLGDKLYRRMSATTSPKEKLESKAIVKVKKVKKGSPSSKDSKSHGTMPKDSVHKTVHKTSYGQASLKNRKKNLKESRRRKKKILDKLQLSDSQDSGICADISQSSNTIKSKSKTNKNKSDNDIVSKNEGSTTKLAKSGEMKPNKIVGVTEVVKKNKKNKRKISSDKNDGSATKSGDMKPQKIVGVTDVVKKNKKNKRKISDNKSGVVDGNDVTVSSPKKSKKSKCKRNTEEITDHGSAKINETGVPHIPKKSKRNKYFHMTDNYKIYTQSLLDAKLESKQETSRKRKIEGENKNELVTKRSKSKTRDGSSEVKVKKSESKLENNQQTRKRKLKHESDIVTTGSDTPSKNVKTKDKKSKVGIETSMIGDDFENFKKVTKRKVKNVDDLNSSIDDTPTGAKSVGKKKNKNVTITNDESVQHVKPKITKSKQATFQGEVSKYLESKISKLGKSKSDTENSIHDSPKSVKSKSALSLKEKMEERLSGARFRYINEQLYSCSGTDAFQMFHDDDSLFHVYHHGYEKQVAHWPVNPLDDIVSFIKTLPKTSVIADFGCGAAKLSRSVKQVVHSFDLVAVNDDVTACDMAKVPLDDQSVDVAVFCLSLMGTNIADYLREANRVLKPKLVEGQGSGLLTIVEVASRITKLHPFIKTLARLGFALDKKDSSNQLFLMMDFNKTGPPVATQLQFTLPPCVYKPR